MTPEQWERAYQIMAASGVLGNLELAEFRRTHGLAPLEELTLNNAPITPAPSRAVADLQGVAAQAERYKQRPARKPRVTRRKGAEPAPSTATVSRWDLLELGEAA